PLDHPEHALRAAILQRLQLRDEELLNFTVFKRSYDARKKNSEIKFVYIIDLAVQDETAVLDRFAGDAHVRPAPDTAYYPVAQAPAGLAERPIVVGFGPCGLFTALLPAQTGFRPILLARGKGGCRRSQATGAPGGQR